MEISIGLITINAKYIHTSLSLRYLRNVSREAGYTNTWIREYTLKQPVWKMASEITEMKPDVVGIGIYIWNRVQSFQLIELLKKQNPNLKIVIGGPEVSFECDSTPDYTVLAGEGENKWIEYLTLLSENKQPSQKTLIRWSTYGEDLPDLKTPYNREDYSQLANRMVYLETSRGCPYRCSFCLSALDKSVRYFEENQIRQQIESLLAHGVKKIKFVDRTFNLQPKRFLKLMKWLIQFKGASFHFEIVGDLLTQEFFDTVEQGPPGMFQFEIGIQTANEPIQQSIERQQNKTKLFDNIKKLIDQNRAHIHADLIFGLPGETLDQILASFTEVLLLNPHELQLGFLKFLPGAPIKSCIDSHEYQYQSFPPYELISHKDLSAQEVIYLKFFNEIFELFYNSKRFRFTLQYLLNTWQPLDLFNHLLDYFKSNDLLNAPLSLDRQYEHFHSAFSLRGDTVTTDLLKLDFIYSQKVFRLPGFLHATLPKGSPKHFKAWPGDRKTPMIPFLHRIEFNGSKVQLQSVETPIHYAAVHPPDSSGYFANPTLVSSDSI